MRLISKLARLLTALALAVPVLLLAALGGAGFVGYSTQIIATGSMEPEVGRGSVVLMRPLAADRLEVGDVVLVPRPRHNGQAVAPVMHRVASISRDASTTIVETKGDANPAPDPDPYVVRERTMTPVLVVPALGYLFNALRTPQGWFLLAILPVLLRTVVVLRRLWAEEGDVGGQLSPSLLAADA